jgi:hypothetical protein
VTEGSAWLTEEGDFERFYDALPLPEWARRKLEIGWRAGIRRTVHVRLAGGWVIGFSRAPYRGDLPPQAYCKRSGNRATPGPAARLERIRDALRSTFKTNGFARFGAWSPALDSHFKIALRDEGLALDTRLLHDLLAFQRDGALEIRHHPETREAWVRGQR